jgi:hypothetical protein
MVQKGKVMENREIWKQGVLRRIGEAVGTYD